jgi:hypothetical protein
VIVHLGWIADGIERAEAAGGVTLEVYNRPGFTGGQRAVRPYTSGGGSGFEISDPEMWEYEDEARAKARLRKR